MKRASQRGSAILVTMIIVVALLGGGAVLVGMQLQSTRSVEVTRSGMSALYCAEAGLNRVRVTVATNYQNWNAGLCNPPAPRGNGGCIIGSVASEPAFLAAISRDLDGDGSNDFTITLVDNLDEAVGNDMLRDNDLRIFVVSTCTKFPEVQKQVTELVEFNAGVNCIKTQKGGCRGMGGGN